ncbi:MAG TPA: hypothetical protein ENJ77_01390, partial [Candidatus Moranbacteria bacterium]|nr:hypothetical protein [Candidatus Moranbacteria bacterium]
DLMTEKEIRELTKRLRAAGMLQGRKSYRAIVEETGLSSATVARVAKWLNSPEGGYRRVLARLAHHKLSQSRRGLS